MQRSRRNHKAAFKAKVAIAAIKGDQTARRARQALRRSSQLHRSMEIAVTRTTRLKPSAGDGPEEPAAPTSPSCTQRSAGWRWRTIF